MEDIGDWGIRVDANLKLEAGNKHLVDNCMYFSSRSSSEVEFLCVHKKLAILKHEYDGRSSKDLCPREESEGRERLRYHCISGSGG